MITGKEERSEVFEFSSLIQSQTRWHKMPSNPKQDDTRCQEKFEDTTGINRCHKLKNDR